MADWTRSAPESITGDLQVAAQSVADGLEARYRDEDLRVLLRAHGLEPGSVPPSERAAQSDADAA